MLATPSAKVAGAGSPGTGRPPIRSRNCSARRVYGPRSIPVECSRSYAVSIKSAGGGSGGATASSGGIASSRVPVASATRTRSPSAHTVPSVPATRVANNIGPRSLATLCITPTAPERKRKCTRYASSAVQPWSATCGRLAADGVELAQSRADLVDHVRSLRTQPTPALARVAPPVGYLRGRHRRAAGCATGTSRDAGHRSRRRARPACEQRLPGREAELRAQQVHYARGMGSREELARLGRVACERLFAQHVTCPAATVSSTRGPCVCGGVAIVTASTASSASASESDVHACGMSKRFARSAVFSASRPTSASTSKPAARNARTCVKQPKPVPTTAACTVTSGFPPRSRPSTASCTGRRRTGSRRARAGRSAPRAPPRCRRRRRDDACSSSAARNSACSASVQRRAVERLRDGGDLGLGQARGARVLDMLDPFELGAAVGRDAQRQQLVVAVREHALQRERGRPTEERAEQLGLPREHRHRARRLTSRRRDQREQTARRRRAVRRSAERQCESS